MPLWSILRVCQWQHLGLRAGSSEKTTNSGMRKEAANFCKIIGVFLAASDAKNYTGRSFGAT